MSAVVAGMKLLDGEVIHAHEPNAQRDEMRRPRNLIRSSVASSAQWTSSITTTVGLALFCSSSSKAENTMGRGVSRLMSVDKLPCT